MYLCSTAVRVIPVYEHSMPCTSLFFSVQVFMDYFIVNVRRFFVEKENKHQRKCVMSIENISVPIPTALLYSQANCLWAHDQIHFLTPNTESLAYTSLVRPLLEYGSACWDPCRGQKNAFD
jgi:hypothetical protein